MNGDLLYMGVKELYLSVVKLQKNLKRFLLVIFRSINHFTSFKPKGEFVIIVSKNKYIYK